MSSIIVSAKRLEWQGDRRVELLSPCQIIYQLSKPPAPCGRERSGMSEISSRTIG